MRIAQFSSIATNQRVDAQAGVIYGVSVISMGEAVTHDCWIDDKTIDQIVELGKKAGNDGIKVKAKHEGKTPNSPLISIVGSLKNFRKDGEHARADFHYLKSDETFDKAMEMAVKQPKDFGLSISSLKYELETVEDKDFFRVKSLESVDLTSDPAANANGLFSKVKAHGDHADGDVDVKLEADGETHKKGCMCKECKMSRKGKSMTYEEIQELVALELSKSKTELAEMQRKIDAASGTLAEFQKKSDNALALSKKAEIDNLMAEAARDGKVVPLDNDDLYTVVNGTVTIKTEPTQLSKMVSKLPKGMVSTPAKRASTPVGADGKPIEFDRRTAEGRSKQIEFSKQRRAEGADSITAFMKRQAEPSIN